MRTEDDIRAAFRALAREAPEADAVLTGVREQLDKSSAFSRQSSPGAARRWMTPLAAAAAVIAVTAAAVVIADGQPARRAGVNSSSLLDQLPRYYMTLVRSLHPLSLGGAQMVVVKDTRTGRTLLTARPPAPYHTFAGITGAADDRTFVLAARPTAGSAGQPSQQIEKLFRARLDPANGTLTMTALPIPQFTPRNQLNGMALSPDGTELALAFRAGRGTHALEIRIYTLAGDLLRTWRSPGFLEDYWLNPASMSWTQTGVLAVNWGYDAGGRAGFEQGLWLLNTLSPSGDLAGHSGLVVRVAAFDKWQPGIYPYGDGLVSSNGETAVMPIGTVDGPGKAAKIGKIDEFSASTGQAIRSLRPILRRGSHAPQGLRSDALIWSNATGSVLVLQANRATSARARGRRSYGTIITGVLSGRRFTPIPGVPGTELDPYGLVF
jgi:hypothetical protein